MKNIPATVAALCIFNGLRISPVQVSPSPGRFRLAGSPVVSRFVQTERYLSRFFTADASRVSSQEYMPLEVFNGNLAVAAWIRAAIGTLQYSYKPDGVAIPNAHDIDPSFWFDDLEGLALLYNEYAPHESPSHGYFIKNLASAVQDRWEEDEHSAPVGTHQHYIQNLYGQADYMRERDQFLTSASSIIRARKVHALPAGQKYPFPL